MTDEIREKKTRRRILLIGIGLVIFGWFFPSVVGISPKNTIATVIIEDIGLVGLPLIAYFIILKTKQPRMEIWKSVSGIFFFWTCISFNYNWPLCIVSIIAAIVYLKHLPQTNGRKGAVIFYMVMSGLGIPFCLWLMLR